MMMILGGLNHPNVVRCYGYTLHPEVCRAAAMLILLDVRSRQIRNLHDVYNNNNIMHDVVA